MLCSGQYIEAVHDVSAGGLVTSLLEMVFPNTKGGLKVFTDGFGENGENDLVKILFAENPAVLVQVLDSNKTSFDEAVRVFKLNAFPVATPCKEDTLTITHTDGRTIVVSVPEARRR